MSYDIWLMRGPDELAALDWNYTSNCAAMWRRAMPETDGLAGMSGMKAGAAAVILAKGIERMESDPDAYEELEPANGWGSFYGQLEALEALLAAFRAHPEATVGISR